MKTLLIIRASKDVCDVEVSQIQTIAKMHGMDTIVHVVAAPDSLAKLADYKKQFDYVYLATHANPDGFGDGGAGGYFVSWYDFAQTICPIDVIRQDR